MPSDTDLGIIRRIKNGEIDEFEILIKKYEKRLFVLTRNFLRTPDRAEDLVQEVFLAAYRNIHSFNPELGHFSTWIMRIARNKCLNAIKKKKEYRSPPCRRFRAGEIRKKIRSNTSYRIQLFRSRGADNLADFARTTVPDMYYFVMGDNRDNSMDSRHFGPVPLADILGKIDFIYLPAGSWSRFGGFPQ